MAENGISGERGSKGFADSLTTRARALKQSHDYPWSVAFDRALLEERLRNWPEEHGSNLHFLLLGDFQPPGNPVRSEALGIELDNVPQDRTKYAFAPLGTILRGKAAMPSLDVPGVLDAIRRVNVFLGALTLSAWGNNSFSWWAWMIQLSSRGGVLQPLDATHVDGMANAISAFPQLVQKKLASAMFWIRHPTTSFYEYHQRSELRQFAGYWNALECLIDAICLLSPQPKLSASDKQARLDILLQKLAGKPRTEDIERFYRDVINPGLAGKAMHAFSICFPDMAEELIQLCFKRKPRRDRLYDVRNAINHGEVDAENPGELSRISYHTVQLQIIVWGLFGRLLPFPSMALTILNR